MPSLASGLWSECHHSLAGFIGRVKNLSYNGLIPIRWSAMTRYRLFVPVITFSLVIAFGAVIVSYSENARQARETESISHLGSSYGEVALVIEVFLVGMLAIVCACFVYSQSRLQDLLRTEVEKKTNELKETNDRLLIEIQERQEAQSKLKLARDDLEQKTVERTAHLQDLNEQLHSEVQERKRLETEVLEIQETERQRIARDLHDDLGQQLTGLSFMLQTLEDKLASKAVKESEDVNQIANFLDQAISQTRNISRQLFAEAIAATGLIPALRTLAYNVNHSYGIDCHVESSETSIDLKTIELENLYRIAQEAVNNAVRHGKPDKIQILLSRENGSYRMEINDDGIGFDSTTTRGLGLRSIEYRARSIGGTFEIDDTNAGCCVRCVVPADDFTEQGAVNT